MKDKNKDKDKKADNSKSKNQKFELIVVEALQDDAYKGIARIDSEVMRELGIKRGDVILIKGNRETVAIADRSYPADIGEGRIRIDGILRKNARAGLGDVVQISKANVHEAKKVIIAPAQQGIMVQGDPDSLRRGLLGRTLVKGDVVILGGVQRRKDLMSEGMGDLNDIFGNLGDILGGMGMGNLGGGVTQIRFIVVSTNPCLPVIITENTEVVLNSKAVDVSSDNIPEINYEDIGGLSEEIKKIREMVEIPMKHPEIFQRLGVEPPKGVLLYGPPGTGKTLLAKAVANESEANFILLNGPEIMSKFYGESEKKIRDIFDEAEKTAPTIIFIDELDAIAPKREEVHGEVERRVVSQILTMMDGLKARGKVIVVGATNRVNAIDPALRRPGRFDREIEIGVPNKEGRLAILKIHTRGMPLTKDVDLVKLAQVTHGFVGADLESLTKEAAMNVLRKLLPEMKLDSEEQISPQILEKLVITAQDFTDALRVVRPSAMREVLVETPNVDWNSVGGLDDVKRELKEAVEWPMKHPEGFKRLNVRPPKGVLLYGPPGTGKTLLAKAAAKESDVNFISVKGPSLLSKWVNDSHKGVAKVFEKARQVSPCIVLIDEIESIASKRGMVDNASGQEGVKVLNQLLSDMDGLEDLKDILIVATTNRPDLLDPAILRPGRFDKILLINAPSEKGRKMILDIHTVKTPLAKDVIISELAKQTEGYTGADLEALVREAAMLALRESVDAVEVWKKHFDEALKKVKPSVSKSTIETYKKIEDKFLESARAAIPQDNSYFG
ncbi:MAG: transitional endoplasmic reticulum ATPase [archaeon GW2011_AR13]|nr:MAG: transitional endoplasmic reticulum ATPase [archaeon GW2011_AR13]HIG94134.1 CDC48 family AAA ATPase [Nanoarchaeota archaeon]HIH63937.1 CDC48 family AAA ATPase [Nanoarchaeota archaeon]HIJ09721.1 CDC48 family AAA ATPase [Nanoarchaeota archaeon]